MTALILVSGCQGDPALQPGDSLEGKILPATWKQGFPGMLEVRVIHHHQGTQHFVKMRHSKPLGPMRAGIVFRFPDGKVSERKDYSFAGDC